MVELILSRDFTTALCVEYCDNGEMSFGAPFDQFIKSRYPSILGVIVDDHDPSGYLVIRLYFDTEEEAVQFKLTHGDTTWR